MSTSLGATSGRVCLKVGILPIQVCSKPTGYCAFGVPATKRHSTSISRQILYYKFHRDLWIEATYLLLWKLQTGLLHQTFED